MSALVAPKPPFIASAKRGASERKGIHRWHPYYAGYSERFVDTALDYLECRPGHIVLDPWAGSGTTGMVAGKRGIDCLCLDINPVMATFASAKSKEVLLARPQIETWLDNLPLRQAGNTEASEPLAKIFDKEAAGHLRSIIRSIPRSWIGGHSRFVSEIGLLPLDPRHSFCLAVAFVTLRQLSGTQKLQNPTWLRTDDAQVSATEVELLSALRAKGQEMLNDLTDFYAGTVSEGGPIALSADARSLPLAANSIDAIITSPPYLTRIDYAISTFPEMMTFGDDNLLQTVRHQTMGAPVITKVAREQKASWGTLCNSVLDAVKGHPTKAAASYYWKNIIQYFMDMELSLQEICRVLKPGSSALIVVQSSYFKEIEIPLGDIYVEAAAAMGMDSFTLARETVKTHMAHVNTKSTKYKSNKVYFEDVVCVRKRLA